MNVTKSIRRKESGRFCSTVEQFRWVLAMSHACLDIGPACGPAVVCMAATPSKSRMLKPPAEFQILIGLTSFTWLRFALTLIGNDRHVWISVKDADWKEVETHVVSRGYRESILPTPELLQR